VRLLERDEKGAGGVPEPNYGPGNDTGQSHSSGEGVASELRSEPVKSSCQYVCDHAGSEGVPVIRHIALPHTRRIDGHDEIASCREMTGHAESAVLARDVEVEIPATDATTRYAYPQQRPGTDTLGHEEIGGDPSAASRREGAHVNAEAALAYGEHPCVELRPKYQFRFLLRHAQPHFADRAAGRARRSVGHAPLFSAPTAVCAIMPRLLLGLVGQVPDTLGVSGENQFPLVRWDRVKLRLYNLPRAWPGGDGMWIIRRPHDVLDADPIAKEIDREVLLDECQMHVLVEIETW
jgi:hypothetical protein